MPFHIYEFPPRDGFPLFRVTIDQTEDVAAIVQHLSLGNTMFVWSCASDGFLDTFSVINFQGERYNVVPNRALSAEAQSQDWWHIASLHSLPDARLYLVAIKRGEATNSRGGWIYGIVDGPLRACTQMVMWFGRSLRTPPALNLSDGSSAPAAMNLSDSSATSPALNLSEGGSS